MVVSVAVACALLHPASAAHAPPIEYVFFPVDGMPINIEWAGVIHVGTLDARGSFHVREKLDRMQTGGPFSGDRVKGAVISFPQPARVYEYRSGRLILGTMMPGSEFIPEAGSKIMRFEDYRYGEDGWIWNLPGYFIRKDKVEEHRAWLKERPGWPHDGWEEEYILRKVMKRRGQRDAGRDTEK
ncbi:MAG TPA: hypothetical protein VGF55_34200 [Gemmataceae bacterium]